ncbi:hypothetical protein PhaeoP48_03753 (plasmid) [Phaeobacter inhibens]|nr:hypothetical protein PhaeoP48_03753 [Phaeobacter inhibens]
MGSHQDFAATRQNLGFWDTDGSTSSETPQDQSLGPRNAAPCFKVSGTQEAAAAKLRTVFAFRNLTGPLLPFVPGAANDQSQPNPPDAAMTLCLR